MVDEYFSHCSSSVDIVTRKRTEQPRNMS